jgi:hypothetical protein
MELLPLILSQAVTTMRATSINSQFALNHAQLYQERLPHGHPELTFRHFTRDSSTSAGF